VPKTKDKPLDLSKKARPVFRRTLTPTETEAIEQAIDTVSAWDMGGIVPVLSHLRAIGTWADAGGTFADYLRTACDLPLATAKALDLLCDAHDGQLIAAEDAHARVKHVVEAFEQIAEAQLPPGQAEAVLRGKHAAEALADEVRPNHRRHARPTSEFK